MHWENEFAREVGVPGMYDYGPQRVTWASTFMTNWIGDEGFLKRLWVQVRRFNVEGDVQWYHGKVIAKEVVDGECRVICDVWSQNQRGEVTAPGQAIALLPSREHGPVRLPASGQPDYPTWGARHQGDAGRTEPVPASVRERTDSCCPASSADARERLVEVAAMSDSTAGRSR